MSTTDEQTTEGIDEVADLLDSAPESTDDRAPTPASATELGPEDDDEEDSQSHDGDAALANMREQLTGEAPKEDATDEAENADKEEPAPAAADPKPDATADTQEPKPEDDLAEPSEKELEAYHPSARRHLKRTIKERARYKEQAHKATEEIAKYRNAIGNMSKLSEYAHIDPANLNHFLTAVGNAKRGDENALQQVMAAIQGPVTGPVTGPVPEDLQDLMDTGELSDRDVSAIMRARSVNPGNVQSQQTAQQPAAQQPAAQQPAAQQFEAQQFEAQPGQSPAPAPAPIAQHPIVSQSEAKLAARFGDQAGRASEIVMKRADKYLRNADQSAWPSILSMVTDQVLAEASHHKKVSKTIDSARNAGPQPDDGVPTIESMRPQMSRD